VSSEWDAKETENRISMLKKAREALNSNRVYGQT
jgi:hypothetical protein